MKDYIDKIEKAERNYISAEIEVKTETREDEKELNSIEGVAAVVEKTTDLGWYDERIEKGAFDDVLNDDVRALFNHDSNFPLARSNKGKGTLDLFITKKGDLGYRFDVPDRTFARDLQDAIKSGDVSQSSFAFRIKEEKWTYATKDNSLERDLRSITKMERLFDVSPVTYPAYKDTTVAARSMETDHEKDNDHYKRSLRRRKFNSKYK